MGAGGSAAGRRYRTASQNIGQAIVGPGRRRSRHLAFAEFEVADRVVALFASCDRHRSTAKPPKSKPAFNVGLTGFEPATTFPQLQEGGSLAFAHDLFSQLETFYGCRRVSAKTRKMGCVAIRVATHAKT